MTVFGHRNAREAALAFVFRCISRLDLGVLNGCHMWIVEWLLAAVLIVVAAVAGIVFLGFQARSRDLGM
jgi:hypothetical protein